MSNETKAGTLLHAQSIQNRLRSAETGILLKRLYGKENSGAALERCLELLEKAEKTFSKGDFCLVSSPGRTELGGNHTDHNHGRVLAAAVRFDAIAAAAASGDTLVTLVSEGYQTIKLDLASLEPEPGERGGTAALLRGTARYLNDSGFRIGGFNAVMDSRVPAGSGMSSSACVEVLFAAILNHLYNSGTIEWPVMAQAGQYAENVFFGKPCGLMDQMACAGGGILSMDFKEPGKPDWRRVDFDFGKTGYALAIVMTGGSHADLTGDYAAIPAEMKAVASSFGREVLRGLEPSDIVSRVKTLRESHGDRAVLRALHFLDENERVAKMVSALEKGNWGKYLKRVDDSGRSSWTLLQNVVGGKDAADQGMALALALTARFLGKDGACRVHGGGFAGTIQAYLPEKRMREYAKLMEGAFGPGCVLEAGIRPEGAVRLA
jgi:galactokinase